MMTYCETQPSAGHCSWSDHDNDDNDDPGVVSEIEDEMLEEIGRVTPVLTPTHSTEDILDMFDKTGKLGASDKVLCCYARRKCVWSFQCGLYNIVWFVK